MTHEVGPGRQSYQWSFAYPLALLWAATCAILLVAAWSTANSFSLPDPDDYLRLVEVRDWLGGQSWFDVNQYRFNPPLGGAMHWSRLVDLPIAAGIVILTPVLGSQAAEAVTLAAVPLFYLGVVMATIALVTRRLTGTGGGLLAALLVVLSPMLLVQLRPMRIDHHAAQIMLAGFTLYAFVQPRRGVNIIFAGIAVALWMHISIEALPYAILIGAVLGFAYLWRQEEGAAFSCYTAGLAGGSIFFYLLTRPISAWGIAYCDAISPAYLLPLILIFGMFLAGSWMPAMTTRIWRALLLGAIGIFALLSLAIINSDCLRGPFGLLDPLVHRFWYMNIREGLPIWFQVPQVAAGLVWSPILGGIGAWLGLKRASDADIARAWGFVAVLNGGALLVALVVFRASAVAHLYALPGCAFLVLAALRKIQQVDMVLPRALATAFVIGLTSPLSAMLAVNALSAEDRLVDRKTDEGEICYEPASLRHLTQLTPSRLLAPIDIGPAILVSTDHSVMASGYHRNDVAMKQVILAFTQQPGYTRDYLRRNDIDYVVYCDDLAEIERYKRWALHGFVARLERGETFTWLTPVNVHGPVGLHVWKVK